MATKIGINGFGRIGRLAFRTIKQYYPKELEVAVVNDLTDPKTNARLLEYDGNYGVYPGKIEATKDSIIANNSKTVKVLAERDPGKIGWSDYGVKAVMESTGLFTEAAKAAAHFQGGAKKVIISAPARSEDITIVLGVNEEKYDPAKHCILSNASYTANCIAPVVKVLHQSFGVSKGLMSTIHAYTNDQRTLDMFHQDLRCARTAAENIVPITTSAARAATQVIPEFRGRLHDVTFRVPVPTVSLCDPVADLEREVTAEERLKGNPASAIFDSLSTMVIAGNMVKMLTCYDNEWSYSCRLADKTSAVAWPPPLYKMFADPFNTIGLPCAMNRYSTLFYANRARRKHKMGQKRIPKNKDWGNQICFVIQGFDERLWPVYRDVIKPAVKRCGLTCIRADELFTPGAMIRKILDCINEARVVIADLTGSKPNVLYETGLSHGLNKRVILITQEDDVPSDLKHLEYIRYTDSIKGATELKESLEHAIKVLTSG